MKIFLALCLTGFFSSAAKANCDLKVVPGKYIGARKIKVFRFKENFCFQVDDDTFTEKTPIEVVKQKLFCSTDATLDDKRWYLNCGGLDIEVTGKPSHYSVSGLRIKPLEPQTL